MVEGTGRTQMRSLRRLCCESEKSVFGRRRKTKAEKRSRTVATHPFSVVLYPPEDIVTGEVGEGSRFGRIGMEAEKRGRTPREEGREISITPKKAEEREGGRTLLSALPTRQ